MNESCADKPCADESGLAELLAVARGDAPADLLLRHARVVDLVMGEMRDVDVAIVGETIAAVGTGLQARREFDLQGLYLAPGLIDAHAHVESSMLRPREFGRLVVTRGVTTVISNPHEVANVRGVPGIDFMREDARLAPVDILMTVPSSVPATALAGAGAALTPDDLQRLLQYDDVVGLGEVMDFPGVIQGRPRLLREIAQAREMPIDGHAPGLAGAGLDAYAAAGIGSDHECCTVEEAVQRLRRGMRVFLREGSAARNLQALLPVVSSRNERWLAFCTDDCDAASLQRQGSIDHLVRMAVAAGVPLVEALRMACLNPAEHYRLTDRGLVAPGRRADLVAFADPDDFRPAFVWHGGRLVARDGVFMGQSGDREDPPSLSALLNTVRVDWSRVDFRIPAVGEKVRVIGVSEGQLITEQRILPGRIREGQLVADPARDLLKLAVIERHRASGRCAVGMVQGLRLPRGAVAGTVAHDHHNLIAAGADDRSMLTAARAVAASGGGQAVALGDELLAHLELPLGGLMSLSGAAELIERQAGLREALQQLGCGLPELFMTLSFLGLEVIPALKLTDFGLIDVAAQQVVSLFVDT